MSSSRITPPFAVVGGALSPDGQVVVLWGDTAGENGTTIASFEFVTGKNTGQKVLDGYVHRAWVVRDTLAIRTASVRPSRNTRPSQIRGAGDSTQNLTLTQLDVRTLEKRQDGGAPEATVARGGWIDKFGFWDPAFEKLQLLLKHRQTWPGLTLPPSALETASRTEGDTVYLHTSTATGMRQFTY